MNCLCQTLDVTGLEATAFWWAVRSTSKQLLTASEFLIHQELSLCCTNNQMTISSLFWHAMCLGSG